MVGVGDGLAVRRRAGRRLPVAVQVVRLLPAGAVDARQRGRRVVQLHPLRSRIQAGQVSIAKLQEEMASNDLCQRQWFYAQ